MRKMRQIDLNDKLLFAILRKPFDKEELLNWYAKGANVYGATRRRFSVPLLVAFNQNLEALELLLQNGATLNRLIPPLHEDSILHKAAGVAKLSKSRQQRLELLLQYDWEDAFHTLLSPTDGKVPYDLLSPRLKAYYDENPVPLNREVQQRLLEASALKARLALREDKSWRGWWRRVSLSLWADPQEAPPGTATLHSTTTSASSASEASATQHLSTPRVITTSSSLPGKANGLRHRRPIDSQEARNNVELEVFSYSFH